MSKKLVHGKASLDLDVEGRDGFLNEVSNLKKERLIKRERYTCTVEEAAYQNLQFGSRDGLSKEDIFQIDANRCG